MELAVAAFLLAGSGLLGWISSKDEVRVRKDTSRDRDKAVAAIAALADELGKINNGK